MWLLGRVVEWGSRQWRTGDCQAAKSQLCQSVGWQRTAAGRERRWWKCCGSGNGRHGARNSCSCCEAAWYGTWYQHRRRCRSNAIPRRWWGLLFGFLLFNKMPPVPPSGELDETYASSLILPFRCRLWQSQPNKASLKCRSVHPCIRMCVRPFVHKKFLRFQWN